MQDVLTSAVNSLDANGRSFSADVHIQLENYFRRGQFKAQAASEISRNAALIVQNAVSESLSRGDDSLSTSHYTHRRYAACIRDLDCFLRYSIYAMLAGSPSVLDERVLNGLKETYQALGIPVSSTIIALQAMRRVTTDLLGNEIGEEIGFYFDYICAGLS